VLEGLLSVHILKGLRAAELSRAPPEPPGAPGSHVLFEQYWVEAGPAPLPDADAPDHFVLTPSVRGHLATLARAALLRKHPILLQVRSLLLRCCVSRFRSLRRCKTFLGLNCAAPCEAGP
jgi:midasin